MDSKNSQNSSPAPVLDQKKADLLARHFNIYFNHALGYGGEHVSSQKSATDFLPPLESLLIQVSPLTVLVDKNSVYIDQWCVDLRVSLPKIVMTFKKAGLQSISFWKGVSLQDLLLLAKVLGNKQDAFNVHSMQDLFKLKGIDKIKLNHVVYRKMTSDETVVKKEEALRRRPENTSSGGVPPFPGRIPDSEEITEHLLTQLRTFSKQLPAGLSAEDILRNIFKLQTELKTQLQVQQSVEKLQGDGQEKLSEAQRLTQQTVVRIILQEYQGGMHAPQRLAQLIRRVLPDIKELRFLLPLLKKQLLETGMPLGEFLEMVQELQGSFQNESLLALFDENAGEIGLSVQEILQGIRENPKEAARLIVLATAIRQSGTKGTPALSKLLTDYIEQASRQIFFTAEDQSAAAGSQTLSILLERLEKELLEKLGKSGISADLIGSVQTELEQRLPQTILKAKVEQVVQLAARMPSLILTDLRQAAIKVIGHREDWQKIKQPLQKELAAQGVKETQRQALIQKISEYYMHSPSFDLPRGVLNSNNTLFFLQRQIKQGMRYQSPFTGMMVSIVGIKKHILWARFSETYSSSLMPDLFSSIQKWLRELDLIGTLGALANHIPFIILPMTDEAGANSVKRRLQQQFSRFPLLIQGQPLFLALAISLTPFDKSKSLDLRSYLTHVQSKHRQEEAAANYE